jgi:chorismate dehydratase
LIFGKIDYLNLLPFHLFLQKRVGNSQFHQIMRYWRGVPSQVNRDFHRRRVDAAFVSSITTRESRCSNLGIVARDEVLSVLVLEGENMEDSESQTSNTLAKILQTSGKVLIGDKALIHKLRDGSGEDLAKKWRDEFNLPFVFAKLCYHNRREFFKNIEKLFRKNRVKIPNYIMKREMKRLGLQRGEVLLYLSKIDYSCDKQTKTSLNKFLKLAKGVERG